jgi:hypothetical protein
MNKSAYLIAMLGHVKLGGHCRDVQVYITRGETR